MHCEGIMAGELKHGPLALVDDMMPIVMIVMRDGVYNKVIYFMNETQKENIFNQFPFRQLTPLCKLKLVEVNQSSFVKMGIRKLNYTPARFLKCRKLLIVFKYVMIIAKLFFDANPLYFLGNFDRNSNATFVLSHCSASWLQR